MATQYFLIKSEPYKYPFSALLKDKRTVWDGVRNFEARNNLRAMKKGDLCLYYHSNEGKEIVGIARVVREAYPDPQSEEDWSVVDVAPEKALTVPVSLQQIKEDPRLANMALVRRSRLSVARVEKQEFHAVLALSNTKL